jgi:hypothetical protein
MATSLLGCSSSQKQVGPTSVSASEYTQYAIYIPITVKIHQLSGIRIVGGDEEYGEARGDGTDTAVVLHVSFLDGDGFTCRGVGTLFVETVSEIDNRIETTTYDLRDPEINRELFDMVTRTYRIEQPIPSNTPSVKVRVSLKTDGGKTISSKRKTLMNNNLAD